MATALALEYPKTLFAQYGPDMYRGTYLTMPERVTLLHEINSGVSPRIPVYGELSFEQGIMVQQGFQPGPAPLGFVTAAAFAVGGDVNFTAQNVPERPGYEFSPMIRMTRDTDTGAITLKKLVAVQYLPRGDIARWRDV